MRSYFFHISVFDLVSVATLFTGLTLAMLLGFAKKASQTANLFLSLALAVIVLKTGGLTSLLLPTLGPLLYFYVRRLLSPDRRFNQKNMLHFCPLLAGYWMPSWLILISVIIYLCLSHQLIQDFYGRLRPVLMDRPRFIFRRLESWLFLLGLFCVLSLFNDALYLTLALVLIGMAAEAILKREDRAQMTMPIITERSDAREKGRRLKEAVAANRLYENAELTLTTLAVKLNIHPHELSHIINVGLEKNFSDFINEFRVRDVARKMQDPAYDRLTLLGIAYESGFNSKRTFNRVFKETTGKTPAEYKNNLKKEGPIDKLAPLSQIRPVVLRSEGPPTWAPIKLKRNYMFRNYLKIAWRNMLRTKVYSALNISGLAAGMAVALLIGLWIYDQYSYDRFLPGYNQLYQVKLNFIHSGEVHTQSGSSIPLIEEFKKNYPEVKYATETDWGNSHSLVAGNKKLDPFGLTVGLDFLRMFPYPLVEGNRNSVFADPNSIVLTESVAKALFGDQDPINKVLRIDNQYNIKVTGVMKDVPVNSTLQFAYLLPYSFKEETDPGAKKDRLNWQNYSTPGYVELQSSANAEAFENKIKNSFAAHDKVNKIEVYLHAAKNWRLLSQFKDGKPVDGLIQYVRIFGIIGVLVLVIA